MGKKLTKSRQITLLKDGLAVGCAANGVSAITGQWVELASALEHALRDWPYRNVLAQVKTHPQSDIRNVLETSARDSAYGGWGWHDGWCSYTTKNNETVDEIADRIPDDEIPTEAWSKLARRFLAELGNDKVGRSSGW